MKKSYIKKKKKNELIVPNKNMINKIGLAFSIHWTSSNDLSSQNILTFSFIILKLVLSGRGHTFSNAISLKMIIIIQLMFKFAYNDVTQSIMWTLPYLY